MREPTPNEKNVFLVSDVKPDSGFPMHKKTKSSKTNAFYWAFFVFEKIFLTFFNRSIVYFSYIINVILIY